MRNADTVLGIIRERGRRGLPLEDVYRQLYNPALYLRAYARLYSNKGAMTAGATRRVMDTINQIASATEHYSIDEAFVHFDKGHQDKNAHHIKQTIRKWTGIPVSIGIGPTKILAKIANTIAKRNPEYGGVVDLSNADVDHYLKDLDVADLWGIDRQSEKFLKSEEVEHN